MTGPIIQWSCMSAVEVVADAGADESSLSLLGVETSVSAIDGDSDCETDVPVVARTGGTDVPGWPTGVVGACKVMVTGAGSGT